MIEEEKRKEIFSGKDMAELFSKRLKKTFPDVDGVQWYDDPVYVKERLELFFNGLLDDDKSGNSFWWFRGIEDLQIYAFESLTERKILLNNDELNIKRIAVQYLPNDPNRNFVYLETDRDEQTGLYKYDEAKLNKIEELDKRGECYGEMYGLFRDGGSQKMIKKRDMDEGWTYEDGEEVKIPEGAEYRTRFLTRYNRIIAPKFSPFNATSDDRKYLDEVLGSFLCGRFTEKDFIDRLNALPQNPHYLRGS